MQPIGYGYGLMAAGALFLGLSSVCFYFGKMVLDNPTIAVLTTQIEVNPEPLRLLREINTLQKKYDCYKLIVSKDGSVANQDLNPTGINIIKNLFAIQDVTPQFVKSFEKLLLEIPATYLRNIPETRLNSPYVLAVTPEGEAYLRTHR